MVRDLEGRRGQVVKGFKGHGEKCIFNLIDHQETLKGLSNRLKLHLQKVNPAGR